MFEESDERRSARPATITWHQGSFVEPTYPHRDGWIDPCPWRLMSSDLPLSMTRVIHQQGFVLDNTGMYYYLRLRDV